MTEDAIKAEIDAVRDRKAKVEKFHSYWRLRRVQAHKTLIQMHEKEWDGFSTLCDLKRDELALMRKLNRMRHGRTR